MSVFKKILTTAVFATTLACAFAITPATNTYAQSCPNGSVQANKEIGVDGVTLNKAEKDSNGNYKDSGKTGKISSLAQCNLDADSLDSSNSNNNLMNVIQTIVNVIISVLGIIAVIVIIIGGFTYITSSGDATKVTKAKNTILYGVIGLIVALLAFAIVNFVLKGVFSA